MRKQVKIFESDSLEELEDKINECLLTINSDRVVNVEHSLVAISHEGAAMKLYSAVVTYLVPIGNKPTVPAKKRVASPGVNIWE